MTLMLGNPTLAAEEFLFSQLEQEPAIRAVLGEGAAARIYSHLAPQEAARPYIVFGRQSGRDFDLLGASRLWTDFTYLVNVIDEVASWTTTLDNVGDGIDRALHGQHDVAVSSGIVLECSRTQPFSMVEIAPGGVQLRRLGGIYRLLVQRTEE